MSDQSSAVQVFVLSTSTAQADRVYPPADTRENVDFPVRDRNAKLGATRIANAIYGHIRAVRALGRTEISVAEIARALSLSEADIARALPLLRSKGIKAP
jgi:hypothetical protein